MEKLHCILRWGGWILSVSFALTVNITCYFNTRKLSVFVLLLTYGSVCLPVWNPLRTHQPWTSQRAQSVRVGGQRHKKTEITQDIIIPLTALFCREAQTRGSSMMTLNLCCFSAETCWLEALIFILEWIKAFLYFSFLSMMTHLLVEVLSAQALVSLFGCHWAVGLVKRCSQLGT